MEDKIENKENNTKKKRGATRHCCYGLCNSDSRYKEKHHMQGFRFQNRTKIWKSVRNGRVLAVEQRSLMKMSINGHTSAASTFYIRMGLQKSIQTPFMPHSLPYR